MYPRFLLGLRGTYGKATLRHSGQQEFGLIDFEPPRVRETGAIRGNYTRLVSTVTACIRASSAKFCE